MKKSSTLAHTRGRLQEELANLRDGPLSYWRAKAPFYTGVRLGLGLAQMFMAALSMVLLFETGLGRFTFISAGFTTLLTLTSWLLFHSQGRK
jgi:hypothetical protein